MWSSWEAMYSVTTLLLWKKMKPDSSAQPAVFTTPISSCFFYTQKVDWNIYLHLYLKISVLFALATTFLAFSTLGLPNSTVRQARYEFGTPMEREIKQGSKKKLSVPPSGGISAVKILIFQLQEPVIFHYRIFLYLPF